MGSQSGKLTAAGEHQSRLGSTAGLYDPFAEESTDVLRRRAENLLDEMMLGTADIGGDYAADFTGSAGYTNGSYTLKGAGADIWGTTDAFNFAYQPLNGNGTIVARVASLAGTDTWAKGGVMIRESLDANARHAMVVVSSGNGVAFQRRTATGGASEHTAGAAGAAPYWVKLARSGSTFTAYQSANGTTWTQIGSPVTISMATSVYVGLALTSHNSGLLSSATFDNVSVQ